MKKEREICLECRGVFIVNRVTSISPKLCPACMRKRIKRDANLYEDRVWRYLARNYVDPKASNE